MAEAIALLPNPLQQGQGARHWVMETQLAPKLIGTPAKRLDARQRSTEGPSMALTCGRRA